MSDIVTKFSTTQSRQVELRNLSVGEFFVPQNCAYYLLLVAGWTGRWITQLISRLGRELRCDISSYALIGLYFVVCGVYVHYSGYTIFNDIIILYADRLKSMSVLMYIPFFLFISLFLSTYRLRRQSIEPSLNFYMPDFWARFGAGLVLMGSFVFMMAAFSTVKTVLPFGHGFPYDNSLAAIDAFLHVGDPWRLLHDLVDAKTFGVFIDAVYSKGWMLFWTAFGFWICVSARADRIRGRYVICLLLTWGLLGNVAAGLFQSAGPIFFERVTGDGVRFGELTTILEGLSREGALAMGYSDFLWGFYQEEQIGGIGSGISAFPSLHVAIVTLNALFVGELFGKVARFLAWTFVAFILFGSVYLGWHYAIDGYASIAVVVAIYWIARNLTRRQAAPDPRQSVPA